MKCLFFVGTGTVLFFWIFSTPKEDNPVPVIFGPRKNQYPLFLSFMKGLQLIEQLFYNSGGCFQKLLDIEEALS